MVISCCQAAKKEMELQRQMEWEQQRRTQLDVLKVKEMGVVERLDREVSTLKTDLSTLVSLVCFFQSPFVAYQDADSIARKMMQYSTSI